MLSDEAGPRSGLHSSVLDRLGARIVAGALPAGHVLTLDGIDREYAVSRSVSRETIRVLESMGLVASRRRVGVTVLPRDRWNVFDPRVIRWRLDGQDREQQLRSLSELRGGVEPAAAALAAARATPEHCAAMTGAVMAMAEHGRSGDLEAYLAADRQFHATLLAASGNEMLSALSEVVGEVLAGRTHHNLMPARPNPAAIRLHADVAEAVQSGDGPAAERAMRAIIDEATAAMLEDR
ncbi:MAG: FadR/GntR family transcriptional regulator [Nocardioidaceae bacterium]